MAVPQAMNQPGQRDILRVVELAERHAHVAPGILILGHLVEEYETRLFQGLRDLDRVDDVVK
jgi:hypothetical protein